MMFHDSDDGSFVLVAVFAGVNWEERAEAFDQATGRHFTSTVLTDDNWQPGDDVPWRCGMRTYRVHEPLPGNEDRTVGIWREEVRCHCQPMPLGSSMSRTSDQAKVQLYGPDASAYGYLWAQNGKEAEAKMMQAIQERSEGKAARQAEADNGIARYFGGGL